MMAQPEATAQGLGLSPAQWRELLQILATHVPEAQVWAYGSRVSGQAHEGSDLDLVLRQADEPGRGTPGLAELREALQASSLPILVEVHDWAALPAAFQAEVTRQHQVLPTRARGHGG